MSQACVGHFITGMSTSRKRLILQIQIAWAWVSFFRFLSGFNWGSGHQVDCYGWLGLLKIKSREREHESERESAGLHQKSSVMVYCLWCVIKTILSTPSVLARWLPKDSYSIRAVSLPSQAWDRKLGECHVWWYHDCLLCAIKAFIVISTPSVPLELGTSVTYDSTLFLRLCFQRKSLIETE